MRRGGLSAKGVIAAFSTAGVVFVPAVLWLLGVPPPQFAHAAAPPPPIAVIQHMSDLCTARVHLSDTIEAANNHHTGRWLIHSEILIGVDLAKAAYAEIRPDSRQAVLRLPQPRILASKVDHDRSQELYVKSRGWGRGWLSSPQLVRERIWAEADRKLQRLGGQPDHIEKARQQAERVLQQLFQGVGWKVRCEWTQAAGGGSQGKE
jgi:hypothetical protein